MTIKNTQNEQLKKVLRSDYIDRLCIHFWKRFPEKLIYLSEIEIKEKLNKYVDFAVGYGIEFEKDVAVYIECTFQMGELFENKLDNIWALEILYNNFIDGTQKVTELKSIIFDLNLGSYKLINNVESNKVDDLNELSFSSIV
jgi:hypothetical protein